MKRARPRAATWERAAKPNQKKGKCGQQLTFDAQVRKAQWAVGKSEERATGRFNNLIGIEVTEQDHFYMQITIITTTRSRWSRILANSLLRRRQVHAGGWKIEILLMCLLQKTAPVQTPLQNLYPIALLLLPLEHRHLCTKHSRYFHALRNTSYLDNTLAICSFPPTSSSASFFFRLLCSFCFFVPMSSPALSCRPRSAVLVWLLTCVVSLLRSFVTAFFLFAKYHGVGAFPFSGFAYCTLCLSGRLPLALSLQSVDFSHLSALSRHTGNTHSSCPLLPTCSVPSHGAIATVIPVMRWNLTNAPFVPARRARRPSQLTGQSFGLVQNVRHPAQGWLALALTNDDEQMSWQTAGRSFERHSTLAICVLQKHCGICLEIATGWSASEQTAGKSDRIE